MLNTPRVLSKTPPVLTGLSRHRCATRQDGLLSPVKCYGIYPIPKLISKEKT
jgi:hypothetical protein